MLPWFSSAEQDYPDRGNKHQDTDNLEGQIVVAEKKLANIPHIICRRSERRKNPSRRLKVLNHDADLNQQDYRHSSAAYGTEPVDPASFLGADVQQHDDEKKEHHYGAGVDQHLDNPDEKCIELHEQRRKSKKRNNEAKRARDRIAIENDSRAESHG